MIMRFFGGMTSSQKAPVGVILVEGIPVEEVREAVVRPPIPEENVVVSLPLN